MNTNINEYKHLLTSTDQRNEPYNPHHGKSLQDRRHSTDIFGDQQTHDTSVLYSVPSTNPSIYSNNCTTSISKKYDLPTIFKELVHEKGTVRMDISLQAKHMLMATKNKAAILLHYRDSDTQELGKTEFTLPVPSQGTQPPFIRLTLPSSISETTTTTIRTDSTLDRNAHAGLVMVKENGELYHWSHITTMVTAADSSGLTLGYKKHHIPLGHKEEIRCVTTADLPGSEYQVAIGTSIGNVYLVRIMNDEGNGRTTTTISETSLYQRTISSTMLGSLWAYYTSSTENDVADIGGIIKIMQGHSSDELVVLSSFYMQIWALTPTKQAKLLSRTHLQSAILDHAIPMLLQKTQAPDVRVQLLDIDKFGQTGWTVLISYTIPEMGDFAQFALVCMEQVHTQQNNDIPFKFVSIYSLPYSVKPSTLKRRPSVHLSNGSIAFVSFDNTVVSIAVGSRFEHVLALRNDTDNEILGTIVKERLEENGDTRYATGLIFTTGSGVLEYKIDQQYITKSQPEGNVYANGYDDESARDMALTRSKLEQAIFFGYNNENPLYFPLQLDRQQKIGSMVLSLTKDIVSGDLELMPRTLDMHILLAQRVKFIQRIPEILKKEDLLEFVDVNFWTDIWRILESCHIGLKLKTFIDENKTNDEELVTCMEHCLNRTARAVMDQDNIDPTTIQSSLDDLISNHVLLLPKCLEHLITRALEDGELGNIDPDRLVNSIGRLIYNIISYVQNLERFFASEYLGTTEPTTESVFFGTSDIGIILHKNFTKVKTCIETMTDRTSALSVEMSCLLVDYSKLLLEVYRKNSPIDSSFTAQYHEERDFIINTLWKLKNKDAALILAKDHQYYPLLVTNAQAQPPDECQRLTEQYVQDYGDEFVRSLISFYSDTDNEERLLHFDHTYDQLVSDVLNGNPKIGWKYHMQKERYKRVYESLQVLIPTIDEICDRKILLSQAKLASLSTRNSDVTPISTILESPTMKTFSNDLELMEAQEQTSSTFKEMVAGQMVDSLDEQVDVVVRKTLSRLVENECTAELEVITDLVGQLMLGYAISCNDYVLLLSSMDNNGPDIAHYLTALYFTGLYANNNNQSQTLANLNRIWKAIYTKDDWESIDQYVKNRQHIELSRLLAQTATYRVLLMCKNQNVVDELILRPGDIKIDQGDNQDKLLERYIQSHRLEKSYFDECILSISL